MEIIERKGHKFGGTYRIYTLDEAKGEGIEPVYWQQAERGGQWCRSDDDYVLQLIDIKRYKETPGKGRRRKHPFLTFPVCRIWKTSVSRLIVADYLGRDATWRTHPKQTSSALSASTERARQYVRLYVGMLLSGNVDWYQLGIQLSTRSKRPDKWARKFLKNEHVLDMVREEIRKHFSDSDVNESVVISALTDAIALAKKEKDPNGMIKGAVELAKMLDMYPEKASGRHMELGEWDYADAPVDVGQAQLVTNGTGTPRLPETEVPPVLEGYDAEEAGA